MRPLEELTTEEINPAYECVDELPSLEFLKLMNQADRSVADAVSAVIPDIARAVDVLVSAFQHGGHLYYVGAGTSGRLGALDASECPPTFSVSTELVQAVIAGGPKALQQSVEAAEDSVEDGAEQMTLLSVKDLDVVCGLSASGQTPFVLGALQKARDLGAQTVGIACNSPSAMEEMVDVMIAPVTGPEIVSGSTRLKAGTAKKLVLNMLTTATMVRLGKVYGNLMVDVRPVSRKLVERAQRIIRVALDVDEACAEELFAKSGGRPKVAIIMHRLGCTAVEADHLLARNQGFVKRALEDAG